MNLRRRHLTVSQLGMVSIELATLGHGGDRRSEDFKSSIDDLKQEEAATLLNISVDTVKQARKIPEPRLSLRGVSASPATPLLVV
jgi:hypothetical protein